MSRSAGEGQILLQPEEKLNHRLRQAFITTFQRSETIFGMVPPAAYEARPIPLRHPLVFYEGHLPAFLCNTLFGKVLGQSSDQPELDRLFARGIDPGSHAVAAKLSIDQWPSRKAVRRYKHEIQSRFLEWLDTANLDQTAHPLLRQAEVLFLILEHELMHQETLLYLLHQLPDELKSRPSGDGGIPVVSLDTAPGVPVTSVPGMVELPAGKTLLGARPGEFDFAWDNELPAQWVTVDAFSIDVLPVTNGQFLAFVEAGGYERPEFWRFEAGQNLPEKAHPFFWKKSPDGWKLRDFWGEIPLPLSWPVFVTQAEAEAFARFSGKRLPTEAEWHRAAYDEANRYPWGSAEPTTLHGNFDFQRWSPVPVGSFPQGASTHGVQDLLGNAWEWTSTPFSPFPGFRASEAYPQYSADFFDGRHYVMKGGSLWTDARLLRRSFRNWFYGDYPYMTATFRCVVAE